MLIILISKKYGIRDFRGGGRQSARETACRVAAGAVAKIVLKKILGVKFNVIGAVTQLGLMSCDKENWKNSEIKKILFSVLIKNQLNYGKNIF